MKSNILMLPKWLANTSLFKPNSTSGLALISLVFLILAWLTLPYLIISLDRYAGLLDPAVLQLLLLACMAFVCMLTLSAFLFRCLLRLLGLPSIHHMVSQFKKLALWQQFVCYWASFALLLLAALLSLLAIF